MVSAPFQTELLEGRDAAGFIIAFSVLNVVTNSCQLTAAQPTPALDEGALSLECGGDTEERTSPGLLTDGAQHSLTKR